MHSFESQFKYIQNEIQILVYILLLTVISCNKSSQKVEVSNSVTIKASVTLALVKIKEGRNILERIFE
ncbi:hypothetical protein EG343_23895 [Chryseobacterium nakagawai]|uniref:Uncharacterized protein n=1 Tax=Chryseobacterium nakagawai TaxID=1241982 RepID=A0AAD0YRL2_CHRNA|nr:hypothetical protein EG343_23895 [Chryseobacterium nakagawai]